MNDFLALAYKIPNISSLTFTNKIKRALNENGFNINKIGFSGTLDPFARGQLILGTNSCTRLFPHIKKDSKGYIATLFLGCKSESLDIENAIVLDSINQVPNGLATGFRKQNIESINQLQDKACNLANLRPQIYGKKNNISSLQGISGANNKAIHSETISRHCEHSEAIHNKTSKADSKNNQPNYLTSNTAHNDKETIESILTSLKGSIEYTPPKFSAKHINGVRAYKLARENKDFIMPKSTMEVFECKLLNYNYPFINFYVRLSEGGFVRSLAQIIAERLNMPASLCYLERVSEGDLCYFSVLENAKIIDIEFDYQDVRQKSRLAIIDIKNALKYDTISLTNYAKFAKDGKKFCLEHASYPYALANNIYLADFGKHYGIISITFDREVKYIVNRIDKC